MMSHASALGSSAPLARGWRMVLRTRLGERAILRAAVAAMQRELDALSEGDADGDEDEEA